MDYRNMLNRHALKVVPHRFKIPDFRLCIGEGERLDSVPVLLFTDVSAPKQAVKYENPTKQAIEKTGSIGSGHAVELDDFTTENFYDGIQSLGVK